MGSIGDLTIRVGVDLSEFTAKMGTTIEVLNSMGDAAEKTASKWENVGSRMASVGAELSAAITLPIVGVGLAALKTAGEFEQTQIAITHFMGSVSAAKGFLAELYNFAATTPFQITPVVTGAQKLMAMGFAAKDVIPMLRILGDQLSAVGRTGNLDQIILAFGEVKAKGVASMKEVRQMITDGVIPAVKYIAEALGTTEANVMSMMKRGAIDSGTAIRAIFAGMVRDTGGMMSEQMASFLGMMSNVKDQLTLTLAAIGNTLLPYGKMFSDFANVVLAAVRNVAQGFEQLPQPVQAFILALAGIAAAVGPALVAIGGMMFIGAQIAPLFIAIAAALGISVGAFLGIAAVIAVATAALVAFGVWVYNNWAPIKAVVAQAWDGIKEIWSAAWKGTTDGVLSQWNFIKDHTTIFGNPSFGISRRCGSLQPRDGLLYGPRCAMFLFRFGGRYLDLLVPSGAA